MNIRNRVVTSCTLLIPRHLLPFFTMRVSSALSLRNYFEYLIVTYGRHLVSYGVDPDTNQWKQKYQQTGLDLQVRNFKPDTVCGADPGGQLLLFRSTLQTVDLQAFLSATNWTGAETCK